MKDFFSDQEELKLTPIIEGFKCRVLVFGLFFILTLLPIVIGVYIWFIYDWLIAIGVTLFLYIVSSIIGSKLRVNSVPLELKEHSLSSIDIAKWYIYRHFC